MKHNKYLYLIRCNNSDFYKIGVSRNPDGRLRELQHGCPYPLILIYKRFLLEEPIKVERALHKKYWSKQIIGEWFRLSKNDIEQIQKISKPKSERQKQTINSLSPKQIIELNKIRAKDNLPPVEVREKI